MTLGILVLLTLAQSPPPGMRPVGTWQGKTSTSDCGGELIVDVRSVVEKPEGWTISFDADRELGTRITHTAAEVITFRDQPHLPSENFAAADRALVMEQNCRMVLRPDTLGPRRLAVHVGTHPSRLVHLLRNGKPLRSFRVGNGLTLFEGETVLDTGKRHAMQMMALTLEWAGRNPADAGVSELAPGGFFVAPSALVEHLIEGAARDQNTEPACCGSPSLLVFKLHMDLRGAVRKADSISGDIGEQDLAVVHGLRFKPFRYLGQGIEATAYLSLYRDSKGHHVLAP